LKDLFLINIVFCLDFFNKERFRTFRLRELESWPEQSNTDNYFYWETKG